MALPSPPAAPIECPLCARAPPTDGGPEALFAFPCCEQRACAACAAAWVGKTAADDFYRASNSSRRFRRGGACPFCRAPAAPPTVRALQAAVEASTAASLGGDSAKRRRLAELDHAASLAEGAAGEGDCEAADGGAFDANAGSDAEVDDGAAPRASSGRKCRLRSAVKTTRTALAVAGAATLSTFELILCCSVNTRFEMVQ